MPIIQRSAVRAATRSASRAARQNAAAFSTAARVSAVNAAAVRPAMPKIAQALKPAVEGEYLLAVTTPASLSMNKSNSRFLPA